MTLGFQSGATKPLNPWLWLAMPMVLALLATVVLTTPVRVMGLPLPEPVFALVPAFACAVIRPSVLAPFGVLLMGLFLDLLWGGPKGLWAVSLLASYALAFSARSLMTGQARLILLLWYAGVAALLMGVGYLLTMLIAHTAPNLAAVSWQWLATVLLFPAASWLIERFEDADVRFR